MQTAAQTTNSAIPSDIRQYTLTVAAQEPVTPAFLQRVLPYDWQVNVEDGEICIIAPPVKPPVSQ